MKLELPKYFPPNAIGPAVFVGTGLLCLILSIWTAHAIERFSKLGVRRALAEAGHSWAEVEADGLQVIVTGTAPTEAMRFRALSVAGNVVDSARLRDAMQVADHAPLNDPEFKMEILRNDDGISLIGLAPTAMDRDQLLANLDALAEDDQLTNMLESADHAVPPGWDSAVAFAESALKSLPRSKISVTPGMVKVTAITDSPEQKLALETRLRRDAPKGLALMLDISAPRPVIAPFTLRFLIDQDGARFDACSADSDKAGSRILAAAAAAGVSDKATCTVGLGVPTPEWADAVVMALGAVEKLGSGSITFSDADIALMAGPDVAQADFDDVVGELESNLPEVFSLKASQAAAGDLGGSDQMEFVARLSKDGKVDLSGRLRDELTREAVESYARARFGTDAVHTATRLDEGVPDGWPMRVLVALAALSELDSGAVTVRAGTLKVVGKTGSKETSAVIARILSAKLGANGKYDIVVTYEESLDQTAALPSDKECVDRISAATAAQKITFEPGKAVLRPEAKVTIDKIAEIMKLCSDYPMEIGGHTDSQGGEEMNLSLSEQRARAVIVALQSRRILTGNLTARGYGETQPIMANDTEKNRETNRRIEFRPLNPSSAAETGDEAAASAINVQTPDDNTVRPKKKPANLAGN